MMIYYVCIHDCQSHYDPDLNPMVGMDDYDELMGLLLDLEVERDAARDDLEATRAELDDVREQLFEATP